MDQNDENKMAADILPIPSSSEIETNSNAASTQQESNKSSVTEVSNSNDTMSRVKSVAEGQVRADEVFALQPEIADTLADFLKDMDAYKRSFPEPVDNRLKELEKMSEAIQTLEKTRVKGTRGKDVEKWSCTIRRDNIRHWPHSSFEPILGPKPIIEAYYDNFEESVNLATNTTIASQDTEDSLQRVVINSDILRSEIEKITSVRMHDELIVPPPFKLLVNFHPQINAQLANLENELAETNSDSKITDENLGAGNNVNERIGFDKEKSIDGEVEADTQKEFEETQEDGRNKRLESQLRIRINHLRCLRDFIQSDLKLLINLKAAFENGSLETISFRNLWYLFKPGDVVLSTRNSSKVLYKVYSVTGGQKRTQVRSTADKYSRPSRRTRDPYRNNDTWDDSSDEEEDFIEEVLHDQAWGVGTWVSFKIDAYSLESNGKYVGPMNVTKKIKHYVGEVRILDLDVYPVQFHPDYTSLLRKIEDRGRKYLKSSGHKSYDGYTVPRGRRDQPEELQGDVFVDLETYLQTHSRRIQRFGKLETSPRDSSVNGEVFVVRSRKKVLAFTNHEVDVRLMETFMSSTRQTLAMVTPEQALASRECLQLMPSTVPGYAFGLRKWCGLDIDLLSDIYRGHETRESNFDDLVIPDSFRDMLTSLVENHTSRSQRLQARETGVETGQGSQHIDIVRGKGQGLIILLHGPPGSGKTSTAETIAAFTQRPLYSITCGDLGLKPNEVEKALQQHTKKASKWGCVLLLDEADVFLMQRDWQNVERNALVSVLLRQLEYYSGILFLTTNRPGVIDEAFLSRIHISLRYPLIDLAATKRMWSNIMNRIERDNETSQIKIVFDRERLLGFAEQHYHRRQKTGNTWNGRQIRNAFQTAIALGTSQRMKMLNKKNITPEQAIASGKRRLVEVKLTRSSLLNISHTARSFEDYMQHLRGNDSDLARQAEVRDDHFDLNTPRATKDYGERQSAPRRADSFGIAKGASAAKTSIGAGKSRQGNSRKSRNISEDDDAEDDSLDERSENSDTSGGDDSDGY